MPWSYPSSVRRQVALRLRGGESVAEVSEETGISPATLFRWKDQALVDAGVRAGVPSVESDELVSARRRIAQWEVELVLTRDACALFDEQVVVAQKENRGRRRADRPGVFERAACRIAGLNRSTWHASRRRPVSDRGLRRVIVADEIERIYQRSRGTYGKRHLRAALLEECEMIVNLKLVAAIMRERGLAGLPRRRKRRPGLAGAGTPSDLVQRTFTASRPNELWCADITEHPARDGKVYCCVILDCFSKMIVARTFSTIADTGLVNNAVDMAVRERVRLGTTVLHADHGSQFTSWTFGENLRRWSLLESLGTVGDCFDNAAVESFWARMQTELLDTKTWATTLELARAMTDYIDNFYNTERRHSYVGNTSPADYERLWADIQPCPQLS